MARWLVATLVPALLSGCIQLVEDEEDPEHGQFKFTLPSTEPDHPQIALSKDEGANELTVIKSGPDDFWADFAARGSCPSDTPTEGRVTAGDVIHIVEQAPGSACEYALAYKPTNSLVFTTTFTF